MSAIEKERIAIEIGGRTFEWVAPVRRVARQMLREIQLLHRQFPSVEANQRARMLQKQVGESETVVIPPIDPVEGLAMIDSALDFFYKWHPQMNEAKTALDDAHEAAISAAFGEVVQFLMRPFAVVQAATTSTERPESTK